MESLELEPERILEKNFDLTYFYNGLYSKHLNYWFQHFRKEQFLIMWDSDLKNNPINCLKHVFKHLDIDDLSLEIDTSMTHNTAATVRFKKLQKFLLKKDSRFKKILGKVLPYSTRTLIRSKILPKIYKLNNISRENPELEDSLKKELRKYFENDQNELFNFLNADQK